MCFLNHKKINNRMKLSIGLFFSIVLFSAQQNFAQQSLKPNVLFIAVDDLKPLLGCYGVADIKTPNIDRLAKMGTVFLSNYCQQSVCGPTRASIMTGMRPDYTKVYDLKTQMRDVNPDIVTIPQYFANNGYATSGIGKIFHPTCVDKQNDKPSWTVPYLEAEKSNYAPGFSKPVLVGGYQLPETKVLVDKYMQEGKAKGLKDADLKNYVMKFIKPSTECIEVPDNAYEDGANAIRAKEEMIELSKGSQPFFMAVGFHRPHLPFIAPKKYWDLYQRANMKIASFQKPVKNGVPMAYHNASELTAYTDITPLASFSDLKDIGATLSVEKQKELIHGYYAAVSYTDAQVGLLLKAIDSLGLSKNTIIVLWGDHGWHLGDHNLWCKHTNFEQATHAPLIISAPGIAASKTAASTEFVDVFPTLAALANLPVPSNLQGKSQVSVMKNPTTSVKDYSVSQYPRSGLHSETERLGYADAKVMGYSIRTKQYRYTIWMKDYYRSNQPFNQALVAGEELYDYKKDPDETVNVVADKMYKSISKEMNSKMLDFFKSQAKK